MNTYAGYTQCGYCGVYDRDDRWCSLCRKPKRERDETRSRPFGMRVVRATKPQKRQAVA